MLRTVSLFIILGAVFFIWTNPPKKVVALCTEPVSYYIGSFDRRFNISYADFLSALVEAEAMWEKSLESEYSQPNIELFAYIPKNGKLAVNLVYDYRQEATEELIKIEDEVKQDQTTYRTLEAQYLALREKYEELKSLYESRIILFNQHNATYSQQVDEWNRGSRTNKAQFQALQGKRSALDLELTALKALEAELNGAARDVNTTVGRLNWLAKTLNLNVEQFNTIGASRGETFAGGIYTSDTAGAKIDIYEFSSYEKLVRVLTHELGHALGLEHIDDPQAVMYYLNKSTAGKLTEADINSLKTLCGIK